MSKVENIIGRRFGRLVVKSRSENDKHGQTRWLCVCDCGAEKVLRRSTLVRGQVISCGCYRSDVNRKRMPKIIGKKFGRLAVLCEHGHNKHGRLMWKCECICGNIVIADGTRLRRGLVKSCGCYKTDVLTTHGRSGSPAFISWYGMKSRCDNPNDNSYHNYGGRGITYDPRWARFENFLEDMGERSEGLTLERIDNMGNYEPSNCRYATQKDQQNNKRTNHNITYNGKTQTLTQWAEELDILPVTLNGRISSGWSVEKSLTEPIYEDKRHNA